MIRQPFTQVPFIDPRSDSTQPPFTQRSRACTRDTVRSANTRLHAVLRPIAKSPDAGGGARSSAAGRSASIIRRIATRAPVSGAAGGQSCTSEPSSSTSRTLTARPTRASNVSVDSAPLPYAWRSCPIARSLSLSEARIALNVSVLSIAMANGTSIGLGLAALGRPGYLNLGHGADLGGDRSVEALEVRTHEVLDAAHDAGIRYFDAARSYGLAERFLGSWLADRSIEPGTIGVGSKWGYTYTADWKVDADPPEVKDLSLDTFRRQVKETLELLGDHLTLYQIHSATLDSGVLDDEELLEELSDLREEGIAVGLTVTGTDQADTIDRAVETGQFDSVQATWNLIERSAEEALQRASDAGMRVLVKEALANGRLAGREPLPALERAARSLGTTPDAVAIAAVMGRPWADLVLSGVATVDQLESNLGARGVALGPGVLEELDVLREPPEVYWERRSGLDWT